MNWTTHGGAAVLGILLVNAVAHAEDAKPKSGWKELLRGPALPAELTKDVDIIRMRITPRSPGPFPPYHLRNLRAGVDWDMQPVGFHPFRGHYFDPGDQQQYAFTIYETDEPVWDCLCKWAADESSKSSGEATLGVTTSREQGLHCDFTRPGGETLWSLDADVERRDEGRGTHFVTAARLNSKSRSFQITPLTITVPRVLGGVVPESHCCGVTGVISTGQGYLVSTQETAVAAVQTLGYGGPRFILHRSLDPADRSLLAAATLALMLNRFADPGAEHFSNQ